MIKVKVLNRERTYTARLENAYQVSYEKKTNSLWTASFRLPLNDPKNEKVQFFHWVELTNGDEYIGLFRIMPKKTVHNRATNEISYDCEHAFATLLDNSLFKIHQLENWTTKQVIDYLLKKQHTQHWKLGQVDFVRYFHYSWENENLLSALLSVPKPFDEQFRWSWDTTSYPWTLNLVKPETKPVCRIKEGYNLIGFEISENPNNLFNRIYPLGAGEGINQLDIKRVNNGIPYLENKESIAKYGLREYVWADRRFTVEENLKSSCQALLDKWKEPAVSWEIRAIQLAELSGLTVDSFHEGDIVRVVTNDYGTLDLRILKEKAPDMTKTPWERELVIGSLQDDLGTTATDLERRQQINELYSQGATNITSVDFQDNCDANSPARLRFYINENVVNVNELELTYTTRAFRAYSKAIKGGGATVSSTSAGGGSTQTSSSGGGSTQTSSSGGGGTQTSSSGGGSSQTSSAAGQSTNTSSAGGNHRHIMFNNGSNPGSEPRYTRSFVDGLGQMVFMEISARGSAVIQTAESSGDHAHSVTTPAHTHGVSIPAHQHSVNIPSHQHNVSIPSHQHSVTIPAHTHQITLPNHTHEIEYGIFEYNSIPNRLTIKVDGVTIPITATSGDRISLIKYLQNNEGMITRGWHTIEILPNGLARMEAHLDLFLFIQSQLGGQH